MYCGRTIMFGLLQGLLLHASHVEGQETRDDHVDESATEQIVHVYMRCRIYRMSRGKIRFALIVDYGIDT